MPRIIQPKKGNTPNNKGVHNLHPYNNQKKHDDLLSYIMARVQLGLNLRDVMVPRFVKVDKQIAGYLVLSATDKKRELKKQDTGQQLATEINLPLTHIHIEDMTTYIAEVVAPSRGIYHAVDDARDQQHANALSGLMNEHAAHADHFSVFTRAGQSALKYNICGIETEWHTQVAPTFTDKEEADGTPQIIWSGNKLNHLNMYNTFWDPCVAPQDIPEFGEFAGKVTRISGFQLKRLVDAEVYHNVETINTATNMSKNQNDSNIAGNRYYRDAALEVGLNNLDSTGKESAGNGETDWSAFLGFEKDITAGTGLDLIHVYLWVNPYTYNLVPRNAESRAAGRDKLELWKFVVASGTAIVFAEREASRHGYIPMGFGAINYDDLGIAQRSVAEIIDPLQTFASFSLNTHIQATRKNIWDLVIYDPSVIDMDAIPDGEVAARIPVKEAGQGKDINLSIWQNSNLIDTKQTVENMNMIMGLLQQFYPTQSMPSQIANIDRAIESQVSAVTQGTTRRMKQAVRMLDSSVLRWNRTFQYYNILQFHNKPIELAGKDGKTTTIQVKDFRGSNVVTSLGQGLKSVDREDVTNQLVALVQMVLQSGPAAQQTDIMEMINSVSDFMGIELDFRQFKIKPPEPPTGGADDSGNAGEPEGAVAI